MDVIVVRAHADNPGEERQRGEVKLALADAIAVWVVRCFFLGEKGGHLLWIIRVWRGREEYVGGGWTSYIARIICGITFGIIIAAR